jgi:hypothetical protein
LRFLIEHQSQLVGTHLVEFGPYLEQLQSTLPEILEASLPELPSIGQPGVPAG